MAIINDSDLLVVQKGGQNYTYSGANLKADITEIGGGGTAPTPSLTEVCAVGPSPATSNRNMQVNGTLISSSTVQGTFVTSTGNVNAEGAVTSQQGVASNEAIYTPWTGGSKCAMFPSGNAHFAYAASGRNGAFMISQDGNVEHRASIKTRGLEIVPYNASLETGGSSTIRCTYAFTLNVGSPRRILSVNSEGWVGAGDNGNFRAAATNIEPIDTSNFIAALKAVNLHIADHPVQEDQRQYQVDTEATTERDVGLFVEDVEATAASSLLLSEDANGKFFDERRYSHFLFGVCKEQQTLIENLTTRIEQLEADHASAMNNMEDDNGSSTY